MGSGNPIAAIERGRRTFHVGDSKVEAMKDVSLSIFPGEIVALVGPSGSGKSTLLHCMGGLESLSSGSVDLFGRPLSGQSISELFRQTDLRYSPQKVVLFERVSSLQNVLFGQRYAGPKLRDKPARARAELALFGLEDRIESDVSTLSGGERQRVALARSTFSSPRLLLCDEPTANLDPEARDVVLERFKDLRSKGSSVLIATHDVGLSKQCDRVIEMRDGRIRDRAE